VARGALEYDRWRGYDIAAAVADYRRALAINPNFADAHHHLCSEFNHLGLHDEAIGECTIAVRLDPQLKAARMRLARAQWQSNRFTEAVATYERFGIAQQFEKATALAYLGRFDEAHKATEIENALPAVTADLASARALIAAMEHNAAEAAAQTRRSAELGRGYPHFHHAASVLAAACAELGRADEAVHWLSIAADTGMPNYPLFSNNPSLRKLRGNVVYEKFLASLKPRWEQIVAQVR
jgi:superkiller protein 3